MSTVIHQRRKKTIKAVVFILVALLLFGIFNVIFRPVFSSQNYNSTNGFYKQPKNTIETLFIGSSHILYGFSPMELYEEYGICAYDLASDGQPMIASYYWLKEAYHYQEETLDTVVLDVSMLRRNGSSAEYHKAFDSMRFSPGKIQAIQDYSENFTEVLWNFSSLLTYHERWKELEAADIQRADQDPAQYVRGYKYSTSQWIENVGNYATLMAPLCVLDETTEPAILDEKAVEYFEKMVSFCEEHDIRLVLVKTPVSWTSSLHNAVQDLADKYGLDFLDFNIDPYYSAIDFNIATDVIDTNSDKNLHANYLGMLKLTNYIGEYLVQECGNYDVRGEESYAFLEGELYDYQRYIVGSTTKQFTNPCDYIEYALEQGEYTIFLSAKDDAAASLTESQRDYYASIGLTQLASLSYRDSYLAVIEDGEIVTERSQKDVEEEQAGDALLFEGKLSADGTSYSISSGGYNLGNESSIVIGGVECSTASRGLNIVLYDNTREQVMDKVNFDTCASSERNIQNKEQRLSTLLADGVTYAELSGTDRILYQYNRSCELENTVARIRQMIGENGLFDYLAAFWDDEELEIYLTVQGDAAGALTEEARTAFAALGLTELAQIEEREAYLAVIVGGEVMQEERGDAADLLEICTNQYLLRSGITESGQVSSVIIDGQEYSKSENGINIVIYDQITESVVDAISFDTGAITPAIIEK